MRTNIDIDDVLMAEALKASGRKIKKAAVAEGFRLLVRIQQQRCIYGQQGNLPWVSSLHEMRTNW